MTTEASIEKYLFDEVKKRHGFAIKLGPTNWRGIPDRLVILPYIPVLFVELKRPKGGRIAPAQEMWRDRLVRMGHSHAFIWGKSDVDRLLGMYDAKILLLLNPPTQEEPTDEGQD